MFCPFSSSVRGLTLSKCRCDLVLASAIVALQCCVVSYFFLPFTGHCLTSQACRALCFLMLSDSLLRFFFLTIFHWVLLKKRFSAIFFEVFCSWFFPFSVWFFPHLFCILFDISSPYVVCSLFAFPSKFFRLSFSRLLFTVASLQIFLFSFFWVDFF